METVRYIIGLVFICSFLFPLQSRGTAEFYEREQIAVVKDSLVRVTGIVTDEDNLPLSRVCVISKEIGIETKTDSIGHFAIHVPVRSTLIFSRCGKVNKRVQVRGRRVGSVKMKTWDCNSDPSAIPHVKYKENEVLMVAEEMPSFPGGFNECRKFLQKKVYREPYGHGVVEKVFVTFVVNAKGKITNAEVRKSPDNYLSGEALRVVGCMPDWIPGKNKGKFVPVSFTFPISFTPF